MELSIFKETDDNIYNTYTNQVSLYLNDNEIIPLRLINLLYQAINGKDVSKQICTNSKLLTKCNVKMPNRDTLSNIYVNFRLACINEIKILTFKYLSNILDDEDILRITVIYASLNNIHFINLYHDFYSDNLNENHRYEVESKYMIYLTKFLNGEDMPLELTSFIRANLYRDDNVIASHHHINDKNEYNLSKVLTKCYKLTRE